MKDVSLVSTEARQLPYFDLRYLPAIPCKQPSHSNVQAFQASRLQEIFNYNNSLASRDNCCWQLTCTPQCVTKKMRSRSLTTSDQRSKTESNTIFSDCDSIYVHFSIFSSVCPHWQNFPISWKILLMLTLSWQSMLVVVLVVSSPLANRLMKMEQMFGKTTHTEIYSFIVACIFGDVKFSMQRT